MNGVLRTTEQRADSYTSYRTGGGNKHVHALFLDFPLVYFSALDYLLSAALLLLMMLMPLFLPF